MACEEAQQASATSLALHGCARMPSAPLTCLLLLCYAAHTASLTRTLTLSSTVAWMGGAVVWFP